MAEDYSEVCDVVFSDANKINEMRAASQALFLRGDHDAALESSRGIAVTTIHMLNSVQNVKHHDMVGAELVQKAEAVKESMLVWIRGIKAGPASSNAVQASEGLEFSLKELLNTTSKLMPAAEEQEEDSEEEGDKLRVTLMLVKDIRDVGQEVVDVIKRENQETTFQFASTAFYASVRQLVERFLKFGFKEAASDLTETSNAILRIGLMAERGELTDVAEIHALIDAAVTKFTASLKHGVLRLTKQQAAQGTQAVPAPQPPATTPTRVAATTPGQRNSRDYEMPAIVPSQSRTSWGGSSKAPGWTPTTVAAVPDVQRDKAVQAQPLAPTSRPSSVSKPPEVVISSPARTSAPASAPTTPVAAVAPAVPSIPATSPAAAEATPSKGEKKDLGVALPASVEGVFDIVQTHFPDFNRFLRKHHRRNLLVCTEDLDKHLIGKANGSSNKAGGLTQVYLKSLGPVGDLARSFNSLPYNPLTPATSASNKLNVVQSIRGLLVLLPEITFAVINNAIGHAFGKDPLYPSGDVLKQSLEVFYSALLQVISHSRDCVWNPKIPRRIRKRTGKKKTSASSESSETSGREISPKTSQETLSPDPKSKKVKKSTSRKRREEKKPSSSIDGGSPLPPAGAGGTPPAYVDKTKEDIFEGIVVQLKERINRAKETLPKGQTRGEVNPASKEAVLSEANALQTVQASEKQSIFRHARGVNALVSQACVSLDALSFTPHLLDEDSQNDFEEANIPSVLQLTDCCLQIQEVTCKLLSAAETYRYLVQNAQTLREEALGSRMAQVVDIEDMFEASGGGLEANIWDETIKNGQVRELNPEEIRKRGTLNELVELLCSDTRIDNTLMRTFLTTYRAFTTPTELFEKLVQRWHCPPAVPSDRARAIQLRVGITLKYWIEHQSRDFDAELRARIAQFLDKTVIPNQAQHALGKMLKTILDKQALEAELKGQFEYTLERVTRVESGGRTLFQYWLQLEDAEIARQMTLIEYRLFSQISPSELLNQSWNKKKLQYRAPNVRALIERANRVVNWTGNMIAWGQNKKERAATFSKFIRICEELFRLNNFNTLMATISALNSASIKRLAASKGLVSPTLMASFKRMDDLLQSTGSYKQYRDLLHSVSPPLLPYMGVYLTDLTFIEDATPDMFENKINFQKRIQAEEILLEVEQYQQTRYGFPIVEPIHTFLYELPISSDNDLYNLSTAREPRNVNPDEIQ